MQFKLFFSIRKMVVRGVEVERLKSSLTCSLSLGKKNTIEQFQCILPRFPPLPPLQHEELLCSRSCMSDGVSACL